MSERPSADNTLFYTPTSTRTTNSRNDSVSLTEDINYLLYLETLKRFKDEETNLRRQMDEKMHQYEEAKADYRKLFELYVRLYEEGVLRDLLGAGHNLSSESVQQAISDVSTIAEKLNNSNKKKSCLDPDILKQCREVLAGIESYNETQEIQTKLMDQKAAVKDIRTLNEGIRLKLESTTIQSLEYFVELIQAKQNENSDGQL